MERITSFSHSTFYSILFIVYFSMLFLVLNNDWSFFDADNAKKFEISLEKTAIFSTIAFILILSGIFCKLVRTFICMSAAAFITSEGTLILSIILLELLLNNPIRKITLHVQTLSNTIKCEINHLTTFLKEELFNIANSFVQKTKPFEKNFCKSIFTVLNIGGTVNEAFKKAREELDGLVSDSKPHFPNSKWCFGDKICDKYFDTENSTCPKIQFSSQPNVKIFGLDVFKFFNQTTSKVENASKFVDTIDDYIQILMYLDRKSVV